MASGSTDGFTRYVRAHFSGVDNSPSTVPTGMPRGYVAPSPELKINVPGSSLARNGTPRISSSHRSAPAPRCGCTMPKAPSSSLIALTRKSGCAQVIAKLVARSTLCTIPTKPSAVTTGRNGCTPASDPVANAMVNSSPAPRGGSNSAGTNPSCKRAPSPSSLRNVLFSSATDFTRSACVAICPRVTNTSLRATIAARTDDARPSSATSGDNAVVRSVAANPSRVRRGRISAKTASRTHTSAMPVSSRPSDRTLRATARSSGEDGPVLLLVVEDLAGTAHHAGERIFVHMNRQSRFLAQ